MDKENTMKLAIIVTATIVGILLLADHAAAQHYCEARFGGPYANIYDQLESEKLLQRCYEIRTANGGWK